MIAIERVLSRLQGVKKTANGWDALCPAHDDKNPSLGIAEGDDGTVLVKCRSQGCKAEAICQAIGLTLADLFPAKVRNGSANGRKRIVAKYNYVDAAGKLLYQVVRYEPKGFRQRRPAGKNAWIWNLKGVKRVLYRLPELLKAVSEGRAIFIVEGEKDAERLRRLGFVSSCNPGGAGKWTPEYSEALRGAHVVILADNDPAGLSHARQVAQSLQSVAARVKIVVLPGLKPKGDVSDWLAAGGTCEQLREIVDGTPLWKPEKDTSQVQTADRPEILITTEEHEVNAEAVSALSRCKILYQRGGQLVRIVRDCSPAAKGIRRAFTPRIEPLPPPLLRERLAANARWIKHHETKAGTIEKPARPPAWCVSAVHAHGEWPGIRHLEAVVDYPVLRPDGTILCQQGYDPETGLFLETAGLALDIPTSLGRQEAIAARDILLDVVSDFPFLSPAHRAAWLAALLTPLARFAFMGPAPFFLVDANVRGAGKGLLLDCICRIITGNRFTIATYTADEDELRKRITSLVLAGDRLVLLDNLEGKFGNAVLDAVLTGTTWKDRILGVNRMAEAPLYMTWYGSGNNMMVAADTARRVCHIRLESPDERPEERSGFKRPNLLAWVGGNRTRLLEAAIKILVAYATANLPDQGLAPWGSFEGWSRIIRNAVVWVGLPDPAETRLLLQQEGDVIAENMEVVLSCWERLDPDKKGLMAAEVIRLLYKDPANPLPDHHADLKAALEAMLGKPDTRNLGNCLRGYRRRIFAGRFIDQAGSRHRAARWAVYPATEFSRRPANTHKPHDAHHDNWESGESSESVSTAVPGAQTDAYDSSDDLPILESASEP
jgi:hypothetical protein